IWGAEKSESRARSGTPGLERNAREKTSAVSGAGAGGFGSDQQAGRAVALRKMEHEAKVMERRGLGEGDCLYGCLEVLRVGGGRVPVAMPGQELLTLRILNQHSHANGQLCADWKQQKTCQQQSGGRGAQQLPGCPFSGHLSPARPGVSLGTPHAVVEPGFI